MKWLWILLGFVTYSSSAQIISPPDSEYAAEAAHFRAMQLKDGNGVIPHDGYLRAIAQRELLVQNPQTSQADSKIKPSGAGISSSQWTALGPGNIGGRIRSIAIHPTNPNKMWIGGVDGGIWASTNAGASWAPVNDFLPNLSISSIVIDPANPNIMYAGTGEGFRNADAIGGAGIFKSTDGGVTWAQLPSTSTAVSLDWQYVNRIAIHPSNSNIILAGTGAYSSYAGCYRSTDGGASWTKVSSVKTLDVKFDPNNGSNAIRGRVDGYISYSRDAGATWTQILVGGTGRTEVAYAKSTPSLVYAVADVNKGALYKSTDGGTTWTLMSTPAHLNDQGWYANAIWVDPVDSNHLVLGGLNLVESSDGGVTFTPVSDWRQQPNSPHADHHAIVSDPGYNGTTNRKIYDGNDGGIYRSDDINLANANPTNNGWTNLNNGLAITQFYSAVGYSGGKTIGGSQDNGTLMYTGSGTNWVEIFGGDGGVTAEDSVDNNFLYGEYVYLEIYRSTDGGVSRPADICSGITEANKQYCGGTEQVNFIAPFVLDPNNNNRMLAGAASLWVSNNVKAPTPTWTSITSPLATAKDYISAIAVAQGNPDLIWIGYNGGEIYRTTNGTSASPGWSLVSSGTNRMVRSILIDASNTNRAYVTYGGFTSGNVQRTTDGGATWADISANLPYVPMSAITRHPTNANWLYLGTEVGLFTSEDGGNTWFTTNDGPANVSVQSLFWADNSTLLISTHGRGVFKTTASATAATPTGSVTEFYNTNLDNYFITANADEAAAIDKGSAGPGWIRTGYTFKSGGSTPVCRFYGSQSPGPNSHFYTVDSAECQGLKNQQIPTGDPRKLTVKSWNFESLDFISTPPTNGTCPAGTVPVYRAYNNGFARGVDSNHRITSSQTAIQEVVNRGWANEGVVMCAPQ